MRDVIIKVENKTVVADDRYGFSAEPVSGGWMFRRRDFQMWFSMDEIGTMIALLQEVQRVDLGLPKVPVH